MTVAGASVNVRHLVNGDAPARIGPVRVRSLGVALAALGLVWIFPFIPATRSPNELCRLWQSRALVDFGTVELNQTLMRYGPVGDLSRFDDATGRHYYPSKAPLLSYMAVPAVWLWEKLRSPDESGVPGEQGLVWLARLLCTVLPSVLVLFPLRRFLEAYFDESVAAALLVAQALGTVSYPYAELFMSHGLTGIWLFLVFYTLWKHRRGEWDLGAFALAGALAGIAVATEYTAALALPALAVYGIATCRGDKRVATGLGLLGVLPGALFLAWYHARCFGSVFETGYKHLNDMAYQHWHTGGFLGITVPDLSALFLSFFSPLRGLFVVSPFLLLALPGLFWMKNREGTTAERRLFWAVLLLYTYFTSSFAYDSWGWTTGPRHLTPLSFFLLLPAGEAIKRLQERGAVWAGGAAALLGVSVFNTGLLTQVNYISDCVRNGVDRLALPLVESGHLPQSLATIIGVPNPWAWLPEAVALLGAMGLGGYALLAQRPMWKQGAIAAVGIGLALMLVHSWIPSGPNTECEDTTVRNIGHDFQPQPGAASSNFWTQPSLDFWYRRH